MKFVEICNNKLGLEAKINPEKKSNPFAPDLIVNGRVADLKVQNTPFFKAKALLGVDPKFAVTFNRKDYERYQESYPDIDVYYWVDWNKREMQIGGVPYKVDHLSGIYMLPFQKIREVIESDAREHDYIRRVFDQKGNARSSFVLDIRKFNKLFETQSPP